MLKSSLFYEVLEGLRRFDVLPDIIGFLRIYTQNVLPMFYPFEEMFYQMAEMPQND